MKCGNCAAFRPGWRSIAWLALMGFCGCGQEGPRRYELSGTVKFAGQVVPAGEVTLEPDAEQGNQGPASLATIRNGRYQTEPNKGVVGGPYIVRILGFDGVPVGDSETGTALFPPYETQVELPRKSSTWDFDVPAPGP